MTFLEELAERGCERLTSREGCLADPGGYPVAEQCDPCRARAELGRPKQAPRRCETCGKRLTTVELVGDRYEGVDEMGQRYCPPPKHKPYLFYDEFVTRKKAVA